MALVACKECGTEVAESAPVCPKCGVLNPAGRSCQLTVARKKAMTGFAHVTEVFLDDQSCGYVKMGNSITVDLPPGEHELVVRAAGVNEFIRGCAFEVMGGQAVQIETGFGAWGGLYVKEV